MEFTITKDGAGANFGKSADKLGFFGKTPSAQKAAIAALTDNSGGTANDTIADVEASYTEATLANNFADLTAKVNAILVVLRDFGLIAT